MTRFKVITPAYNCENTIEQTIASIYSQSYTDWEMVVIDDVSDDATAVVCNELASRLGIEDKLTVIRREEKHGETKNTLDVCKSIEGDQVVVRVDGGDWVTDLDCFFYLDKIYSEADDPAVVWTAQRWAYTNTNISGPLDPHVSPYRQPWKSSHLKTFRRSAMDDINPQNYLDDDDEWIMIACDQAVFLPMLEKAYRAGRPNVYVNACMYHYNINLNDPELFIKPRSQHQKTSAEWIRARGYVE